MYNEKVVSGYNNSQIMIRQWEPEEKAVACLHILHGLAEHSGRYTDFAKYMARNGVVVWAHDHRQHGESITHDDIGIFDETDTWEAVVEDVAVVQDHFVQSYPDMPMLMLGHSMGSLILRTYVQIHQTNLAGVIVMGSPSASIMLAKVGVVLAKFIESIKPKKPSPFLDNLAIGSYNKSVKNPKTSSDWLSYDEVIVARFIEDPMSNYIYSPSFYGQLASGALMANNESMMKAFPKVPTMFISGALDPSGQFGEGVRKIASAYKNLGIENEVLIMEDMRHEILNEVERRRTFDILNEWIKKQL